ncbi:MAG TPA: ribosome-binding factor A, partial [Gammaproteobacteria bacterium]|nr:ribosome-binding factor A [Gammaproteobacteria bacterium]
MSEMSARAQRIADQIQREIATLIQLEASDPRIGMVSVTGVDVSNDLAHA